MSNPDYSFWDSIDQIQVYAAAYLWCELDPPSIDNKESMTEKVESILDLIVRHCIDKGEWRIKRDINDNQTSIVYAYCKVARNQLIILAEKRGEKPKFLYPESMDIVKSIWFIQNNTYFSSELDIAIKAHKALFIEGEPKNNKPIKSQILEWLHINYKDRKELSNSARTRIAVLVNPDQEKRGGPPS